MRTATGRRRCAGVGVTFAAASLLAVSSTAPPANWPSGTPVAGPAVRLTADGDSVLNIPFNLFQQIVNIPNTEVEALNTLAASLFFTGPWFAASATNIWGEDPGDPGHFMALVDILIPFKEISGLGSPEIDPVAAAAGTAGLGQQLALLAAAELPADASCDADWCAPLHPTMPITGLTPIDLTIWQLATTLGLQRFPLNDNWFQVPFSELTSGYTFGAIAAPSAGVGPGGAVPDDDVFGFPGTVAGPHGENLMPWSNITFTLNLLGPFQNFYNSLLAPPDPAGFAFPSIEEIGRTLQSLAAAMVVGFNPFVPGSGTCWGECDVPAFLTSEGIVKTIAALWPGNSMINHWLDLSANGLANGPTQHQIDFAMGFIQGLQTVFDLGNPPPSEVPAWVETPAPFDIDPLMSSLIQFAEDSGIRGFVQALADLAGFEPAF